MLRLQERIRYAVEHGALTRVDAFLRGLPEEEAAQRRRSVQAKLDRGYDDCLEGRISEGFWARKSAE